jgi:hypothetical protein
MIERDYILRMIQMLTAALAKVLFHKDLKQYGEALREIDLAGEKFIGMKWEFLRTFSDDQLIGLLGYERQQDKMLAAAELLREETDILRLQGKEDEGAAQGMKAFSLFAELILRERSYVTMVSAEKFSQLLAWLKKYEFPPSLKQKEMRYYEVLGNYAKAEDALFELLELDPSFAGEGISFYERLLKRTDDELREGGLPKDEVQEGLSKVHSMRKG